MLCRVCFLFFYSRANMAAGLTNGVSNTPKIFSTANIVPATGRVLRHILLESVF